MKNSESFYQAALFDKNREIERCDYNIPFLEAFLPGDKKAQILDAGCGNGKYAAYLAGKGYRNLVAVDLFDSIPWKEVSYRKASIEALPFDDHSFDVVYSNSVIYHLPRPEEGIAEFSRVLKPGGILIFSGHTRYSLHTLWRRLNLRLKTGSFENLRQATFYSTCQYLKILRGHQFEILHTDGFRLGLFLYPYYRRKIKWFEIHWNIKFPLFRTRVSRIKFIGRMKAALAYHFVITGRKKAVQ
ncbi:MAG: class I SAM-dependent methyltransferase [Bacteroidales bacterium]|nr:class I SAM-dependent methyltransferase [Bacteroidales bacterium]MBN2761985.1 class I SAM-dependent methyltransferase [Bacteroidales bacterium]